MDRFVKFTVGTANQYGTGLVYPKNGRVEDNKPWDPHACVAGGIHFCRLRDGAAWCIAGMTHVSDITIPEDEKRVVHWLNKSKAQSVIISNMRPIAELFSTFTDAEIQEVTQGMPRHLVTMGIDIPPKFHTRPERTALVSETVKRVYDGVETDEVAGKVSGQFTREHRFLGLTTMYPQGTKFTCAVFDGLAQGVGTITMGSDTYEGTFVDGLMQGAGTLTALSYYGGVMSKVVGTFVDGQLEGEANYTEHGKEQTALYRAGTRVNADGTPFRAKCRNCGGYH